MARRMARTPWHVLVFPLALVTISWADAAVSPFAVFRSGIVAVGGTVGTAMVLAMLLRNVTAGGVLASLILLAGASKAVGCWAFGLLDKLAGWQAASLVALILSAFALALHITWRQSRLLGWSSASRALTHLSVALLTVAAANAFVTGRWATAVDDLRQGNPEPATSWAATVRAGDAPDIYVILLDSYARADTLKRLYGFDNSPFLTALETKGFVVAHRSATEYPETIAMLVSMLHLRQAADVPGVREINTGARPLHPSLRQLLNHNPAWEALRRTGYEVITTGSGIERYAFRQADTYLDRGWLNEFEIVLLGSTFFGDVINILVPGWAAEEQGEHVIENLADVASVASVQTDHPRFVLSHIISPHDPIVFGPDCEERMVPISPQFYFVYPNERRDSVDEFVEGYVGQVQCLNSLVLSTVDDILTASARPPVIVLMSDTGPAGFFQRGDPTSDTAERLATFFAALTPGEAHPFGDNVQPANVIKVLLDTYVMRP